MGSIRHLASAVEIVLFSIDASPGEYVQASIDLVPAMKVGSLLDHGEIGSRGAESNAGASAMRSKEFVLSGILQACLRHFLSIDAKLGRMLACFLKHRASSFS